MMFNMVITIVMESETLEHDTAAAEIFMLRPFRLGLVPMIVDVLLFDCFSQVGRGMNPV